MSEKIEKAIAEALSLEGAEGTVRLARAALQAIEKAGYHLVPKSPREAVRWAQEQERKRYGPDR